MLIGLEYFWRIHTKKQQLKWEVKTQVSHEIHPQNKTSLFWVVSTSGKLGGFPQLCGSKHQNISTFCAGHSYHGHLWHLWLGLVPLVHCHGMDGWMSLGPRGSLKIGLDPSWNLEIENPNGASDVDLLCLCDDYGKKMHFWRCGGAVVLLESLTGKSQKSQTHGQKRFHVVNVRIDLQYSNHLTSENQQMPMDFRKDHTWPTMPGVCDKSAWCREQDRKSTSTPQPEHISVLPNYLSTPANDEGQ